LLVKKDWKMKTYAVLFAPEFHLQAALRHRTELADQPVALLESDGTKPRLGQLNLQARKFQLLQGMTLTQAMARCPHLRLLSPDPGQESSAQDTLLQRAETLSPFLEATAPGVITIELPAERLFTKVELVRKCIQPLASVGLEMRLGLAATPDLALLAARFAQPVCLVENSTAFLAPLPLETLEPSPEMAALLASWGIRTIGQLVALPRTQACERLGPETVALWERATGGQARPLKLIKPREFYAEATDLEHPVEMLEPLLFLLRRFLEQITLRLSHAYLVAGKLRLVLRFASGSPYRRTFTIPQPTRDVSLLFRMLHTHLENFTAEFPIVGLELAVQPVRPNAEQFELLQKGMRDPHQFAETLARLQALLGADRVGSAELEPSHHPDAFHLKPYVTESTGKLGLELERAIGVPWLRFRPPIQARIILNDLRQPEFIYSSRCTGPINEAQGPWHLEGNWWESRRWFREEWDIATDEGLYRLVLAGEGWFLDGIYA
jgi:protein ImuB